MFGGNFEMELAQMELGEGSEALLGEGPENQQTNIKWVRYLARTSFYLFICTMVELFE